MPRVTRAALRSNTIMQEEADSAATIPLPSTPRKDRAPLGEITRNLNDENVSVEKPKEFVNATKKAPGKDKKIKGTKKVKKQTNLGGHEDYPEVLEDDSQSATSSAVEEACQELLKENTGGKRS